MNTVKRIGLATSIWLICATTLATAGTNVAPVISGTPATSVAAGTRYAFRPTATDANGDRIRFSMYGKPSWGTFNRYSGEFTGVPPLGLNATFSNIVITASDRRLSSSLPQFSIKVTSATANIAPIISGSPATTVAASSAYTFKPTASDANGDALSFSIQNKPAWANFSIATGQLSGTASAIATMNTGIIVSVSDGTLTAALPAFSIAVQANSNQPPTIAGTPRTQVLADSAYSFQPTAADPERAALTFSIQNKPAWASFNAGTGLLSGTPTSAQLGSFGGIVVGVSDGTQSVTLPAFSINVTATASGTVAISWTPPTLNTDGSTLSDLAGYRLYYGTALTALTRTVQVVGAGTTSYVLSDLTSGTWYFALTSYSAAGTESALSNVASKAIP
jgi:hypothetical protein